MYSEPDLDSQAYEEQEAFDSWMHHEEQIHLEPELSEYATPMDDYETRRASEDDEE